MRRRSRLAVVAGLLAAALVAPADADPAVAPARAGAVIGRTVIGTSVQGRDLVAYHLGEPGRPGADTVVLIATMHGNEPAPRQILDALVDGQEVIGLDLWVVPNYNPDGLAAGTRTNARGVDLNRNFPYQWRDLDGRFESGRRPASEPETRAVMRFLRRVAPDYILSFHQPFNAVGTDTKSPAFARRVARVLKLPTTRLDCGGVCTGTMTSWFNHGFDGAALTVEYGPHPSRRLMRDVAPDQVLRVFSATRGEVRYEPLSFGAPEAG